MRYTGATVSQVCVEQTETVHRTGPAESTFTIFKVKKDGHTKTRSCLLFEGSAGESPEAHGGGDGWSGPEAEG